MVAFSPHTLAFLELKLITRTNFKNKNRRFDRQNLYKNPTKHFWNF